MNGSRHICFGTRSIWAVIFTPWPFCYRGKNAGARWLEASVGPIAGVDTGEQEVSAHNVVNVMTELSRHISSGFGAPCLVRPAVQRRDIASLWNR